MHANAMPALHPFLEPSRSVDRNLTEVLKNAQVVSAVFHGMQLCQLDGRIHRLQAVKDIREVTMSTRENASVMM